MMHLSIPALEPKLQRRQVVLDLCLGYLGPFKRSGWQRSQWWSSLSCLLWTTQGVSFTIWTTLVQRPPRLWPSHLIRQRVEMRNTVFMGRLLVQADIGWYMTTRLSPMNRSLISEQLVTTMPFRYWWKELNRALPFSRFHIRINWNTRFQVDHLS